MFCAKPVRNIPRASIKTENAINCIYNKRQVGKKPTIKNKVFSKKDKKTPHFCTTSMPIYTLGNPAMKSLFRNRQGHILPVLAKKYIFTKHLQSYKDYPKELFKNCLRFSLAVDKTIHTYTMYHTVFLDASGETRKGSLKLSLSNWLTV